MVGMIRRNVWCLAASVGLAWSIPGVCLAQYGSGLTSAGYGSASGFGYRFASPDPTFSAPATPSTRVAARTGPTAGSTGGTTGVAVSAQPAYGQAVYNPYLGWTYTMVPPSYTGGAAYGGGLGNGANYGVWANAPSAMAYTAYALPGNYYRPAQGSYLPYSPYFGSTPAGLGFPLTAITFQTPNGPMTLNQAATNVTGNEMLYRAGYPGYTAPTPYYSYGLYSTFGTNPATPIFGAPTPSITTPRGAYGNQVSPSTGAPMPPGTTIPGVSPAPGTPGASPGMP